VSKPWFAQTSDAIQKTQVTRTAGAPMQNIPQLKSELRAEARRRLNAMTAERHRLGSDRICRATQMEGCWKTALWVGAFYPKADEVGICSLLTAVLDSGRKLVLPGFSVHDRNYSFRLVKDLSKDLVRGEFQIMEPHPDCPEIEPEILDLILVPGLSFDSRGGRLGRGRGFYDRLLMQVRGEICGLAFSEQVIPSVPSEPHDIRVHRLVTPDFTYDCRCGTILNHGC
jgi:5-formyltetrahydrofolate cyclo-ligase